MSAPPPGHGWRVHNEVGADGTIHVWPESENHDLDGICWCKPALEEQSNGVVLVTHRDALDRMMEAT